MTVTGDVPTQAADNLAGMSKEHEASDDEWTRF